MKKIPCPHCKSNNSKSIPNQYAWRECSDCGNVFCCLDKVERAIHSRRRNKAQANKAQANKAHKAQAGS